MKKSPRTLRNTAAFVQFVLDQLEALEPRAKAMFGGAGLYAGDVFFGIIARDVLYLKVDDVSRHRYEDAGMKPFQPYPDRPGTMQYYAVPISVLESGPEVERWARDAVRAARASSAPA
jgi:DNA transformation protein